MACIDIPDIKDFKPVRDDYTAGFANGVEAVRDWLRQLPRDPSVATPHQVSDILDDMIEQRRNAA